MSRAPLGILAATLTVALLAGCTAASTTREGDAVLPADDMRSFVDAQAQHPTPEAAQRLADGLPAPTNAWFSGLVFGDQPQAVFPLPLSFVLQGGGFALGVPEVTSSADAVSGPAAPVVQVGLDGDDQIVSRYDDISVTIDQRDGDDLVGQTLISRGSPVVSYAASTAQDVRLQASFVAVEGGGAGGSADGADAASLWAVTIGDRAYGLVAPDAELSADGLTLSLPEGATASWFAAPDGDTVDDLADLADAAGAVITSVATGYSGDRDPTTRLSYTTASGGPTLVGALAHQRAGGAGDGSDGCDLGSYSTTYGAMTLCATDELAWSSPRIEPTASLGADDLAALTAAQRDELTTELGSDIAASGELAADTYFGGKQLARLANLLQLARDLGDDELAATAQTRLAEELRIWTEPGGCDTRAERCFAYDPTQPGVVGFAASFGADEYNDHHFHYGYFLYAAAIAAADDEQLRDDIAPVITLLAADLASGRASELFPARRTFDPYSGHSWASGFSPFGDGNNQESSSEAVAAWNGLALWAETAGDDDLDAEARWMLAAEAASARTYWTDFDRSDPAYAGYEHGVVGIVWDGKRDYSTWFSPEPAAILGIQLIPMTGVSDYLAGDPDRIRANVAEVDEAPQFADLLLMYSALAGPEDAAAALDEARDLPDAAIDDGNARSLLFAWLMVKAE